MNKHEKIISEIKKKKTEEEIEVERENKQIQDKYLELGGLLRTAQFFGRSTTYVIARLGDVTTSKNKNRVKPEKVHEIYNKLKSMEKTANYFNTSMYHIGKALGEFRLNKDMNRRKKTDKKSLSLTERRTKELIAKRDANRIKTPAELKNEEFKREIAFENEKRARRIANYGKQYA